MVSGLIPAHHPTLLSMKINREASVFLAFALIVSILSGNIGAWFKLIGYTIGLITVSVLILSALKTLVTPKSRVDKNLSKIQDDIHGVQTITLGNLRNKLPVKSLKTIKKIHNNNSDDVDFVKNINAVEQGSDRLPDHLTYPIAKKAMFELQQKHGTLKFNKVPSISNEEIIRPLSKDEVDRFHLFCNQQVIDLH
jgi:hypothetical protein